MNADLVAFLHARLAEDEQAARQAASGKGDGPSLWVLDDDYRHDTLVIDPARVLAEVAAKRRIVELHDVAEWPDTEHGRDINIEECAHCLQDWPCLTLRLLALPLVDHPDYRQEWKP